MADLAALNIEVGADLSQLEQALPRFNASVDAMGKSVQKTNAVLDQNAKNLAKVTAASSSFSGGMAKVPSVTNSATLALGNFGRVLQDAPYGFIGISNNLNPLLESFQRLGVQAKAAGTSVGSVLIKSLTGAGGLGFALSAVTAALGFAQLGLSLWTRGFGANKKAAEDAAKANEQFFKSAAQEITNLRVLEKVATDTSNAYSVRKKAVDELQKSYPGYLKNISDEAILNGQAAKAIDAAAAALAKRAYLQAAESTLTDLANKQLQARKEETDLIDKQRQAELELAKAKIESSKAGPVLGGSTFGGGTDLTPTQQAIDKANGKLAETQKQLEKNRKSQQALNNDFQYYLTIAEQFKADTIKLDPDPKGNVKEKIDKIAQALLELKNNIRIIDLTEGGDPVKKYEEIYATVKKLLDLKVPENGTIIQKLLGDANKLYIDNLATFTKKFGEEINKGIKNEQVPVEIKVKPILNPDDIDTASQKAFLDQLGGLFKNAQGIEVPVSLLNDNEIEGQYEKLHPKLEELQGLFADGLPGAIEAFHKSGIKGFGDFVNMVIESQNAVQDFMKSLSTDAIASFGEAIGKALTGGNVGDVFANFFQLLGEGLKTLGKQIIATVPLIQAIKKALFTNPTVALAAGVALVAIGSVIENSVPKLAGGGIIPPGFEGDRFPAFLNSGEAVIPLDKLNKYINTDGSTQVVIPEVVLKGSDLVIAFNRQQRKNNRVY